MSTKLLLVICAIAAVILLRFVLPKTAWFRRVHMRWLVFRAAWNLHKIKQFFNTYDAPESKLKRAREAVKVLRAGLQVIQLYEGDKKVDKELYLTPEEIASRIGKVNEALEAGFSYKQICTTREEVIGFRNGEAHKTSARLQVALSRAPEQHPREYEITRLAKDAGFALEKVGTSAEELAALSREYNRRLYSRSIDRFRQWATGASDRHEDPDEFERHLDYLLSPDGSGFSYEDFGISAAEFAELMRLARRREVEHWIKYLKRDAEEGGNGYQLGRRMIRKSLQKAELTLAEFNISDAALDEIERSVYLAKARDWLSELRAPGESWFYMKSPPTAPQTRIYKPALVVFGGIPGDPLGFVRGIEVNLAEAKATLADIGTSETEIKTLVRAGHIASAQFLIGELSHPTDRAAIGQPYPIERDIQAIEYHLRGAGVDLTDIGGPWQTLQELRAAIGSR